jgi:uncharacterized membrane protein
MDALHDVGMAIGVVGVVVIVWGVLLGMLQVVRLEMLRFKGKVTFEAREELRHGLAYYLLLGLEFLVAADIVHSILTPTLQDLAVLAAIVAIRTVISFSINWELRQSKPPPVRE